MDIGSAIKRRVCLPIEISGSVEKVIETLLRKNIISPKNHNRKMPFTKVISETATGKTINFSLREPQPLCETINRLCANYNLRLESTEDIIWILKSAHKEP